MSHLGASLSALLDGELTPSEGVEARAHLADCNACRAELDRTRAIRAALRSLPPVEPPAGFVAGLAAGTRGHPARWRAGRRSSPRLAAASLVASLAMAALLVTVGAGGASPGGRVAPLDAAVVAHGAAMAAMGGERAAPPAGAADEPDRRAVAAEDVPAPYVLPAALDGGYRLAAVFQTGEGLHAVYTSGDEVLSLLEVPGQLDWDSLPSEGRTMTIDGSAAWMGRSGRWTVVLVERDGLVQAAVAGDAGGPVVRAVASTPPPRSLSFGQRLRRACQQTLADLGVLRTT